MDRTSTHAEYMETSISVLQGDAWAAWNASYYAEDRDAFRNVSKSLYQQDVSDRISALFRRLDAQNAELDAVLRGPKAA